MRTDRERGSGRLAYAVRLRPTLARALTVLEKILNRFLIEGTLSKMLAPK
jgi:hypothetical protein